MYWRRGDKYMNSKLREKIILSYLKEVSEGNKPHFSDYINAFEISKEDYFECIEWAINEGLVNNITFSSSGSRKYTIFDDNASVTRKGEEYLVDNSSIMKTYRGLKEIREWLPF